MPDQISADHISALSCELSIHRKGCISVHINLDQGILTWRESRQWCNDFTRSISTAHLIELRNYVQTAPLVRDLLKRAVAADPAETICLIACRPRPAAEKTDNTESGRTDDAMDADPSTSDLYRDVDFSRSSWQITFSLGRQHYACGGNLPLPVGWHQLQIIIEKLSRSPFRLL